MEFIGNLIFYSIEFVCLVGVAVAGIFIGKKLKDRKNAKANN